MYSIHDKTRGTQVFSKARIARSFLERLCGLMLKEPIDSESALIFYNAGSIHTCFMLFPIDIIFCDKELRVISVRENVGPWRMAIENASHCTIECCGGLAKEKGIAKGDQLVFIKDADA